MATVGFLPVLFWEIHMNIKLSLENLQSRWPQKAPVTGMGRWREMAEDVGFEPTRVLLPARVPGV